MTSVPNAGDGVGVGSGKDSGGVSKGGKGGPGAGSGTSRGPSAATSLVGGVDYDGPKGGQPSCGSTAAAAVDLSSAGAAAGRYFNAQPEA